ncbi:hypothetical protein SAMN04487983_1017111 [Streptomyces sp. yr375]|uniref:hypothetical protein n=1 Tax=Streptomyces sp. yr375 TaxID=1761906 RepID=UPI0008C9DFE4|nr:hypothetical protein [Streptomyces sp. yr375]SER51201.1 hypothetical protein SAMN04487983_1017111 [Streptomyces sp. yr375]
MRGQRDALWAGYRALIEQTGRRRGDEALATRLACGLVESVVQSRPSAGEHDTDHVATGVADAILRTLGCTPAEVTTGREAAARLAGP